MNEVSASQNIPQLTAGATSSKGAGEGRQVTQGSKDIEIKQDIKEVEEKVEEGREAQVNVNEAVTKLNDYVQSIDRDLQFHVDDELEQTVIKVVDSGSGKLIRQIPEDIFLELARNLQDKGEVKLLDELG